MCKVVYYFLVCGSVIYNNLGSYGLMANVAVDLQDWYASIRGTLIHRWTALVSGDRVSKSLVRAS